MYRSKSIYIYKTRLNLHGSGILSKGAQLADGNGLAAVPKLSLSVLVGFRV